MLPVRVTPFVMLQHCLQDYFTGPQIDCRIYGEVRIVNNILAAKKVRVE